MTTGPNSPFNSPIQHRKHTHGHGALPFVFNEKPGGRIDFMAAPQTEQRAAHAAEPPKRIVW